MQHNVLNSTVDTIGVHVKFNQSATYCITVEGHLDNNWTDRLGDMTITSIRHEDQRVITSLAGGVRDQAELFGVLNTLYELHIPLLAVKILTSD